MFAAPLRGSVPGRPGTTLTTGMCHRGIIVAALATGMVIVPCLLVANRFTVPATRPLAPTHGTATLSLSDQSDEFATRASQLDLHLSAAKYAPELLYTWLAEAAEESASSSQPEGRTGCVTHPKNGIRVVGTDDAHGQYIIASRICVSPDDPNHPWIPRQLWDAEDAQPSLDQLRNLSRAQHDVKQNITWLPPLLMQGLATRDALAPYAIPIRDATPSEMAAVLAPVPAAAVVYGIYFCEHWSHWFVNSVQHLFGSWLRLQRLDSVPQKAVVVNVHAHEKWTQACRLDMLDPFFVRHEVTANARATVCYGPAIIGSRGQCSMDYCYRGASPEEHAVMRSFYVQRHSGGFRQPRLQPQRIGIVLVQRLKSRVFSNLQAMLGMLRSMDAVIEDACAGVATKYAQPEATELHRAYVALMSATPETRKALCSTLGPVKSDVSVIMLEHLSFRQQVDAVSRAHLHISSQGNAEGNTAWMQRGGVAVEISLYKWASPWFRHAICRTWDHAYFHLPCEELSCWDARAEEIEALAQDKYTERGYHPQGRNITVSLPRFADILARAVVTIQHRRAQPGEPDVVTNDCTPQDHFDGTDAHEHPYGGCL